MGEQKAEQGVAMRIQPIDWKQITFNFEPGIAIRVQDTGTLDIQFNTWHGRLNSIITLHPHIAFAVRDFLNEHYAGDYDSSLWAKEYGGGSD